MPIQLPQAKEVPLKNPPITEVIAQVRFPALLSLLNEPLVEFQEAIRDRFPELTQENTVQIIANSEQSPLSFKPPIYRFSNPRMKSSAVLSADFFAVTTNQYSGWRDFLGLLDEVYSAVSRIYRPSYATRQGLRYTNHLEIDDEHAGGREALLRMVRDELTTTLRGEFWADADQMVGVVSFADQDGRLNLRYGYEVTESSPTFLLDLDYFEEGEIPLSSLPSRYERYHAVIYNAFRWCVKDDALSLFGGEV